MEKITVPNLRESIGLLEMVNIKMVNIKMVNIKMVNIKMVKKMEKWTENMMVKKLMAKTVSHVIKAVKNVKVQLQ